MIRIRTKGQIAGLRLMTASLVMTPYLLIAFNEWKEMCELMYSQEATLECVFFEPHSIYFTPMVVFAVLLFTVGLVLIFLPNIKKRL